MNKSDTCQSKKLQLSKRPFAKKQKKTVFNADKKSQQATLSTFGSRNSAERFKKIVDKSIETKSKLELRT